jgi:hypothetical protein
MEIAPIKTQRDCRNALKEIESIMTAKRNTPEPHSFAWYRRV